MGSPSILVGVPICIALAGDAEGGSRKCLQAARWNGMSAPGATSVGAGDEPSQGGIDLAQFLVEHDRQDLIALGGW